MPREVLYHEFCKGAERFKAEQIVVTTESGFAARQISKYRTYIPTIVITPHKKPSSISYYLGD
jgi:pyruvate kinase